MTEKDLLEMVITEEKKLGVSSREFLMRHNEIMELIESLMDKGNLYIAKTERRECK